MVQDGTTLNTCRIFWQVGAQHLKLYFTGRLLHSAFLFKFYSPLCIVEEEVSSVWNIEVVLRLKWMLWVFSLVCFIQWHLVTFAFTVVLQESRNMTHRTFKKACGLVCMVVGSLINNLLSLSVAHIPHWCGFICLETGVIDYVYMQ